MTVQKIDLPEEALCGHPPRRLFEQFLLYPDGMLVGLGAEKWDRQQQKYEYARKTVFDSLDFVLAALSVDKSVWNEWLEEFSSESTIDFVPCRSCRKCIPEGAGKEAHGAQCRQVADEWVRRGRSET